MGRPEWGTKRTCHSCGERYYDLGRNPVVCPHCGATGHGEKVIAVRRPSAAGAKAPTAPAKVPVAVPVAVAVVPLKGDSDEVAEDIEDVKVDDDLIEDTSDLGEDDDDIAEAMEHVVDEKVVDGN